MTSDRDGAEPSPLFLEGVLKAAEVARIGVSISVLEAGSSHCVYATEMASELLGIPGQPLVGRSLRDFIVPEHVQRLLPLAEQMRSGLRGAGGVVEVSVRRPGGEESALELAYAPTTLDGQPAVVTFLINVGEQRATARRVKETAQRLAQLIDQTPDAVVISRRGVILEANPAAARMLGMESGQQLVGRSLAQFVVPEEVHAMRERMASVARGEHPGPPMVYRATRADGELLHVEIASFASEYGGEPAITAFGRDVTERERMQEQLARTERLAALGTLAAGVAHEINNPLAALALNTEVVARAVSRATTSEQDRLAGVAALAELRTSVERMTAIVRDLTGFSRSSTEQFGAVNVATAIDRALRVARHATRQRATVRLSLMQVPPAFGHAGKLEQVLLNLLVNAAQSFPPGRPEAENEIVVRTFAPDPQHVSVEVTDNGVGIAPSVLSRVFEPFVTTKPAGEGTGLGLFVSHNAVLQMEGALTVHSDAGGTTMRVSLRAAREEEQVGVEHGVSAAKTARGRVLIVDDEPSMCRSLKSLLSSSHEVSTADGGEAALEAFARGERYDVVLCDLMMPGLNGMELFAELERRQPGLQQQIIFMTGGAFTAEAREFLGACSNPRLQKPFAAAELEGAIQQMLSRHRPP